MSRIESVLKDERCSLENANGRTGRIAFFGKDASGKIMKIVTRLDEEGNIYADLSEVTILTGMSENKIPPPKPLGEVVKQAWERGVVPAADGNSVSNSSSVRNPVTSEEHAATVVSDGTEVMDNNGVKMSVRSMRHDLEQGRMIADLVKYGVMTEEQARTFEHNLSSLVDRVAAHAFS